MTAARTCNDDNRGYLATINSVTENNLIASLCGGPDYDCWIGYNCWIGYYGWISYNCWVGYNGWVCYQRGNFQ
jgi:hypothetical protein